MRVLQREANRAPLTVCPPPNNSHDDFLMEGGGQNANKLCKKPFDKPTMKFNRNMH